MTAMGTARQAREDLDVLAHAGHDSFAYRERALRTLRKVIPFDGFCWWTTDPATGFFTSALADPDSDDPDLVFCRMVHANEFVHPDYNKFRVLATRPSRVGVLSEATRGELDRSDRYQRMLRPIGFEHELRLASVAGSNCWGALMLLRTPERADFSAPERRVATQLADNLAVGLRLGLVHGATTSDWGPDGPGLILLDEEYNVITITPSAEAWLRELDYVALDLPEAVLTVAAAARQDRPNEDGQPLTPRARVRARSGRWLTIHGSRTRENHTTRASTAIIIEEAKPAEIAPMIAHGYGLSPREAELTRLVLQGMPTKEIAASLLVSPYTVQDYLKSVFEKVGVRSRRELVARLFDQHWPNYGHGDRAPEPDGTLAPA